MSKIFDAYKKQVGESADLALEIGRAGSIALFPSPKGNQQADFSQLASRILGLRQEGRGTIISFASTASGEGASFVSYHAAYYLATVYNQKVAWVDINYLSPQAKLRGEGRTTFRNLLQNPKAARDLPLDGNPLLIGGGADLMMVKGLFAGDEYPAVLRELSRRFDFVILDLPPILASTDTALMSARSDGLLLVVEQKFLKREVVNHGITNLREKGVTVLGSIINRREFLLPKIIYDRL